MTTTVTTKPRARKGGRFTRRSASEIPSCHIAVAYIRVSTDEQALGPEAQRAAIETFAARQGYLIDSWHEDLGVSGTVPCDARPGFHGAIAAVRRSRAGVFLVAKLDRLARDVVVGAIARSVLSTLGCAFRSAAGEGTERDDPESVLLSTLIQAFAAHERAMIAFRTKSALRVKIERGERVGAVRYGFAQVEEPGKRRTGDGVLRRVVPDLREREAAWIARHVVNDRAMTTRRAGRVLEGMGYLTRKGTPWHPQQVARLLVVNTDGVDAGALWARVNAYVQSDGEGYRRGRPHPPDPPLFG